MNDYFEHEHEAYPVSTYVVTAGPHTGRICESDDDEFLERSYFGEDELALYDAAGVEWKRLRFQECEGGPYEFSDEIGAHCEYVSFGCYLQVATQYVVPQQCLRPATMNDLVSRHRELNNEVMRNSFNVERDVDENEQLERLFELLYVSSKIWERERNAKQMNSKERTIFLCHSSADKPFVRQVHSDLVEAGHNPWMDEFEIKVGESIVDKIEAAHEKADYLFLFLSETSVEAPWVKREWQSALMGQLSQEGIRIVPIKLDGARIPSLLRDIKYADFRNSYLDGLGELHDTLSQQGSKRGVGSTTPKPIKPEG